MYRHQRHGFFLGLLVAGALMTLSGCEEGGVEAESLPDASMGRDIAVLLHIDAEAMSPENLRSTAMAVLSALPERASPQRQRAVTQLDEALAEYRPRYEAMTERGGRAMAMAVAVDETGPDGGMILVRTEPGADLAEMRSAIASFAEAQDEPMPDELTLDRLNETWGYFTGVEDFLSPESGSDDTTRAFREALERVPGGAKIAFRMTDVVRVEFAETAAQAPPIFAPFAAPIQRLEMAVLALSTGASPSGEAQMRFADEASAEAFLQAWNGLIQMGRGFAQSQLSQMPEPPSNEALNGIFDALSMTRSGATLSMRVDQAFFENLAQVAPFAMPMRGNGGLF